MLKKQTVPQNSSFLESLGNTFLNKVKDLARTCSEEYVIPVAFRNEMCVQLHMLRTRLTTRQTTQQPQEQAQLGSAERQKYQDSAFLTTLNTSDKGFFESIACASYNELPTSTTRTRTRVH